MSWIESHAALEGHPKLTDLMSAMSWGKHETIGRLHSLWWWCQKYAEDGDLRSHGAPRVAAAMGIDPKHGRKLLKALMFSKFVDKRPYARIHDWWKYVGPWLRAKYKRTPEKWEKIRLLYVTVTAPANPVPATAHRTGQTGQDLPNQQTVGTPPGAYVDKSVDNLPNKLKKLRDSQDLLAMRMPFGGVGKKGVMIQNLEPDYCRWLLEEWKGREDGLSEKLKAALQLRVDQKEAETLKGAKR